MSHVKTKFIFLCKKERNNTADRAAADKAVWVTKKACWIDRRPAQCLHARMQETAGSDFLRSDEPAGGREWSAKGKMMEARRRSSDDLLEDVFAEIDESQPGTLLGEELAGKDEESAPAAAAAPEKNPTQEPTAAVAEAASEPPTAPKSTLEASPIDDYYASSTTWSASPRAADAPEDEDTEQDPLNQAIPVEKLKNGARTAMELWSWGFAKVKEKTKEISENENVKQATEQLSQMYGERVKPGVDKVVEASAPVVSSIKEGANSLAEKSKPKIDELRERSAPAIEELSVKASESWTITKQKVGELSEACRPGLQRATESTKKMFGAQSSGSFSAASSGEYEPPSNLSGAPLVGTESTPSYDDI